VADWRAERQGNRAYKAYRERAVRERGKQSMGPGPGQYSVICHQQRVGHSQTN
jgi:hypothetical protein